MSTPTDSPRDNLRQDLEEIIGNVPNKNYLLQKLLPFIVNRDNLLKTHFRKNADENTSDGYHTFRELYAHRIALFIALMQCNAENSWWSHLHNDGSEYKGWILAGMSLPAGGITYHLPESHVHLLRGISELPRAPKWDGHTPDDTVKRLNAWSEQLGGYRE